MSVKLKHAILFGAALAALGSSATAAEDDWAHGLIQQFLSDLQEGVDFSQDEFHEIVSADDAAKLKPLKDCDLKEVTRTAGDAMAIVHFVCGAQAQPTSVMLTFEDHLVTEIDVVGFVQVGAKSG